MSSEGKVYEMLINEFKINIKDAHIITLRIKNMVEKEIPSSAARKFQDKVPRQVIARCGGFNSCRNRAVRGIRRLFLIKQDFE